MPTYQDVVRLQISMDDAAFAKMTKGQEDLISIRACGIQVDANVVTKLLQHLAKVHAQVLERHTKMALVLESPFEPDNVLLVLRIRLVELLQDGDLSVAAFT